MTNPGNKKIRNIILITLIILAAGGIFFATRIAQKTAPSGDIAPAEDPLKKGKELSPGQYALDVAGFKGILYLGVKNGAAWGSLRFPGWGKGAVEPLKNVRISGRQIRFIRSVSTPAEKERTGSTRLFTQEFRGSWSSDGRTIKGYYLDGGAENNWQAVRK